jgi:hypothetical protein
MGIWTTCSSGGDELASDVPLFTVGIVWIFLLFDVIYKELIMNDLPQEFSDNLAESIDSVNTISNPLRISAQELHKYVLGLIGVFMLMVITYPISMNRVAQKENFAPYKSYLKSLTLEYKPVEPQ